MKSIKSQAGMGVVEVILVLSVLGLAGFIGWRVYEANKSEPVSSSQNQTSEDNVPAIQRAEDLDTAVDTLNSQDIDGQLDTSEMDEALE